MGKQHGKHILAAAGELRRASRLYRRTSALGPRRPCPDRGKPLDGVVKLSKEGRENPRLAYFSESFNDRYWPGGAGCIRQYATAEEIGCPVWLS